MDLSLYYLTDTLTLISILACGHHNVSESPEVNEKNNGFKKCLADFVAIFQLKKKICGTSNIVIIWHNKWTATAKTHSMTSWRGKFFFNNRVDILMSSFTEWSIGLVRLHTSVVFTCACAPCCKQ